jgi:glucose-6-phosphate 1-dehydrogenase
VPKPIAEFVPKGAAGCRGDRGVSGRGCLCRDRRHRRRRLAAAEGADAPDVVQAFYFSVAPACSAIWPSGCTTHGIADARSRIVVEKPFGRDLASARALNATLARAFHRKRRSTGSTIIWARKRSRT